MLSGRDLGDEAANGPRVAIVNEAFADRLFPGGNPLGSMCMAGAGLTRS